MQGRWYQVRNVVMLFVVCLSMVAIFAAGGCSNKLSKDRNKIRLVNAAFWSEIAAKNGAKAIDLLAPRTIEYFDSLLNHVQRSGPSKLNTLSFFDRSMVLVVRNRMDPAALRRLKSGRELAQWYFETDYTDGETNRYQLGEITITKNSARAEYFVNDVRINDYKVEFVEQGGSWKFDWLSLVGFFEGDIKQTLGKAKVTIEQENKYLLNFERERSTKNTSPAIWEPPMK